MAAEYEKPQAEDEAEEPNGRQSHSGKNGGLETEVIYFKDPTGRRFTFPFSIGKTWHVCFIFLIRSMIIGETNNCREWKT